MDVLLQIALIAAGALAGVVVTVVLQEPLQRALARLLGGVGPLRGASVKGNWRSTYTYVSTGRKQQATQIMQLRQFGPFVVGRCLGSNGHHRHFIRGRLHGSYFTGVWHNVADKAQHQGALQLVLAPDGQSMKGKWIGYDRHQKIQHGDWEWQALPADLTPAQIAAELSPPPLSLVAVSTTGSSP